MNLYIYDTGLVCPRQTDSSKTETARRKTPKRSDPLLDPGPTSPDPISGQLCRDFVHRAPNSFQESSVRRGNRKRLGRQKEPIRPSSPESLDPRSEFRFSQSRRCHRRSARQCLRLRQREALRSGF